jgi:hypothetical protein
MVSRKVVLLAEHAPAIRAVVRKVFHPAISAEVARSIQEWGQRLLCPADLARLRLFSPKESHAVLSALGLLTIQGVA